MKFNFNQKNGHGEIKIRERQIFKKILDPKRHEHVRKYDLGNRGIHRHKL